MWFFTLVLGSLATSTTWGESYRNTNREEHIHVRCAPRPVVRGDAYRAEAWQLQCQPSHPESTADTGPVGTGVGSRCSHREPPTSRLELQGL